MRVIAVLHRVFSQTQYSVVAGGLALLAISAALLLPHWQIIAQIGSSSSIGLWDKLSFVVSLYGTIGTSYTVFSGLVLVLSVVLFGINIALLIFYIRRRQSSSSAGSAASLVSLGGMVSATLGIGCAACGSVVVTAVLGLLGAGGLLVLLPFHGAEFGVLGVVLLLASCWYLIKKIDEPLVCQVK